MGTNATPTKIDTLYLQARGSLRKFKSGKFGIPAAYSTF